MKACLTKSVILAIASFITSFISYLFGGTLWYNSAQSPLIHRASLWDFFLGLFTPRTLIVSIELAFTFSAIFFALMQPEYLTNSFRFTSQDTKILVTYFVIGIALACVFGPTLLDSLGTTNLTSWLALTICAGASATMLSGVGTDGVNLILTSICEALIGLAIMVAFLANLKHLGEITATKDFSERAAFIASVIGFSGIVASALCFLSDRLYYMNRNITIYVYLMSSAFPVGFLLISTILHYVTAKLFPISSASLTNSQASSGNKQKSAN